MCIVHDYFAMNQPVGGVILCKLSIVSSNTSVDSSSFSSSLSDLPGEEPEPGKLSADFPLSVSSNKKRLHRIEFFFLFSGF